MNELLGKISSYNLFNYLFSGVLFVVLSSTFTSYSFIQDDLITGVFIYYFIGLIVSRIGSLIIDPLLKLFSFVKFTSYSDFVTASKKDVKLEVLSEINNMYRTLVSVCVCTLFLMFYSSIKSKFWWVQESEVYIFFSILAIIFLFSYRKQTSYITKRINTNLKDHE